MNSIDLQNFSEDVAYQVQAVLETISRLGERVEIYDGERLVGTILRGEVVEDDEPLPIEDALKQHQKRIEQYEAEESTKVA